MNGSVATRLAVGGAIPIMSTMLPGFYANRIGKFLHEGLSSEEAMAAR